ncbi:MAG: hypothetical protein V3V10_08155 [Planctomycetota bacterium]
MTTENDIFASNTLYQEYEVPVMEHYSELYDCVYVTHHPFFKMPEKSSAETHQGLIQVPVDKARSGNSLLAKLGLENAEVYRSNSYYPEDLEIQKVGKELLGPRLKHQVS